MAAAIYDIENSLYLSNRSSDHDESLKKYADWGRKKWKRLKFAHFRNSRGRTVAILEIKNSPYICNRSTNRDEILHEHADCGCKPCKKS